MARLRQESCDWLTQSRGLQAELERERQREKEEREQERDERMAEVQKLTEHFQKESKVIILETNRFLNDVKILSSLVW